MATTTTNLGLTKPIASEYYDIGVFNTNSDVLDAFALAIRNGRNLLDNWDFKNAINQRGASSLATAGYFIDRWVLLADSTASIGATGLTLDGSIVQRLEKWNLDDKNVTCTINIAGTLYKVTLLPTNSTDVYQEVVTGVTIGLYNGTSFKEFRIITTEEIVFISAEVREGNYSFLNLNSQGDYALEMVKCRRYYNKLVEGLAFRCVGFASDGTTQDFLIILPESMRILPTYDISDFTLQAFPNGSHAGSVSSTAINSFSGNTGVLRLTGTGFTGDSVLLVASGGAEFIADL